MVKKKEFNMKTILMVKLRLELIMKMTKNKGYIKNGTKLGTLNVAFNM